MNSCFLFISPDANPSLARIFHEGDAGRGNCLNIYKGIRCFFSKFPRERFVPASGTAWALPPRRPASEDRRCSLSYIKVRAKSATKVATPRLCRMRQLREICGLEVLNGLIAVKLAVFCRESFCAVWITTSFNCIKSSAILGAKRPDWPRGPMADLGGCEAPCRQGRRGLGGFLYIYLILQQKTTRLLFGIVFANSLASARNS